MLALPLHDVETTTSAQHELPDSTSSQTAISKQMRTLAGFNCAEAVNFGPPDWLPFGSDRAQKYRDDAKPLTLSHDALLVTLVGARLV